jgi:hypothetical protein
MLFIGLISAPFSFPAEQRSSFFAILFVALLLIFSWIPSPSPFKSTPVLSYSLPALSL